MMLKIQRASIAVAVLVTLALAAGCAQGSSEQPTEDSQPAESSQTTPRTSGHLVMDTGAEGEPRNEINADWPFNVNDPLAMYENSSAVIAGKVIAVEQSYLDGNGIIVTAYTVQVEKTYKGDVPETISLTLPGGSIPLGEYISALDKLDMYEMKLGQKSDEFWLRAGEDPEKMRRPDPRTMDPATPVNENWGVNPTSESLLEELQPESWVFYIGEIEGDTYYGAAFDHAMSYLKEGLIYSVHPEAEGSPIPESEFGSK